MSVTTTITCDRCHNEYNNNQMFTVNVTLRPGAGHTYCHEDKSLWNTDWCQSCCEQMGLKIIKQYPPVTPAPKPPTFEDLIREIVQDVIDNNNP